jgi:hypothetical protein
MTLTGRGVIDDDAGTFTLTLDRPDGPVRYTRDADGVRTLEPVAVGSQSPP